MNGMENTYREQHFVVSHNVGMRGSLQKVSSFPKEKEVLFFIALNSVVEFVAMVYSGAKSTNRC